MSMWGKRMRKRWRRKVYRGLISGLGDPYADYYTAEEYEQLLSSQEGYYEGVGITIGQTESETGAETPDGLEIVEVKEDSPAAQAGIQAGDRLLAVNGTDVTDMSVTEVATLIRTAEDETIVLTLSREGSDEEIVAEVTRERLGNGHGGGKNAERNGCVSGDQPVHRTDLGSVCLCVSGSEEPGNAASHY